MSHEVVIASGVRTPIGSFQGAFASLSATDLGAIAVQEAVRRAGCEPAAVEHVFMGCVLPAALGQAPARQCVIKAGLPTSVSAITVNKVCGSGLQSVMFARRELALGEAQVVVAGGMESMTNAPYALRQARDGYRMGPGTMVDTMIHDGLWDPYKDVHMGACGDLVARHYGFTREAQDAFAAESYRRALAAQASGVLADEIVPVPVPQRRGDPRLVDRDEEPARGDTSRFAGLRPAFTKDGTVTAANASTLNDGAAALVLTTPAAAARHGMPQLARVVADATAAQEPEWFTTAPVKALAKIYENTGRGPRGWDLYEINEAFAGVTMAAIKEHGLDPAAVNVRGGAIALGHPIGCSGARVLVTLLAALRARGGGRGIASLCLGGGEAVALAIETL
jgi:acetyl-CoA C-acetyltransferase